MGQKKKLVLSACIAIAIVISGCSSKKIEVRYGLETGRYTTRAEANTEMDRYIQNNMIARVIRLKTSQRKKFAVIVGSYESRKIAEAEGLYLKSICLCEPAVVVLKY